MPVCIRRGIAAPFAASQAPLAAGGSVRGTVWHALTVALQPYDAMTIREFGPSFPDVLDKRFQLELLLYIVVAGLTHAVALYRRSTRREREAALLAGELNRARLEALERQLQPHFLSNTMNAIAGLVREARSQKSEDCVIIEGNRNEYMQAFYGTRLFPFVRRMFERA